MILKTLLAAMLSIVAMTTDVRADRFFDDGALREAATAVGAGQCRQDCEIAEWRLEAAQLSQVSGVDANATYFIAVSKGGYCGSRGCVVAYLMQEKSRLYVLDEGYSLDVTRPLTPTLVQTWSRGSREPSVPVPAMRAGIDMGRFLEGLAGIDLADEVAKETAVQAAGLAVELAMNSESPRLFLDAFGLNGAVLAGVVLENPGRAAQLATQSIAEGIAKDLAVAVMADLVTEAVFSRSPLVGLGDPWKATLQAALRASIYEFGLILADGASPGAAVSGVFRRVSDIWAIYEASRSLADDRTQALIALAGSIESAVVLATIFPSERNAAIAADTVRQARQLVSEIVGRGDAPVVEELVTLSFMALMAIHTDRRERAEMLLERMYEQAQIGSTNRPLYARLDPRQWLPALASLNSQTPAERALHALIASTRLRELTEAPPLDPVPGITQGALAIARDLNETYGNDRARLRLVSEHADHALLALAAYGDEAVLAAAALRGWVPVPGYELTMIPSGDLGGPVVARLFRGSNEQIVLAFRGTADGRDWVTNLGGTTAIPFTTGQIRAATQLAVQLRADYPGIIFVGHSLGGRMAQVARLATGRPAVIFNSAPLGIADPLFVLAADAETMVRTLMARDDARVSLHRFRSPADLLTQAFPPGDTEVSNVVTTEALTGWAARVPGFNLIGKAVYKLETQRLQDHSMGALAPAMEIVRIAHEQGWIEAYYATIEPTPEEPAAPPQWFERLVPGGRLTGYGFGQFPSLGNRTHAGVNIGGGCGLPVLAAADGEVAGVLTFGDGKLDALGHALLLRHAPEGGRPVNTLYLHLQARPTLSVGQSVTAGQEIGRTGATGTTGMEDGCLLHFEVRHFEDWLHPDWLNILGPGDWRETPEFRTGWSDPEGLLRSAENAETLSGLAPATIPGAWHVAEEASFVVRVGEQGEDFSLMGDGSAFFRGNLFLGTLSDFKEGELRVFRSPFSESAIVILWDNDYGGLRVALINLIFGNIVRNDFIPERSVRGIGRSDEILLTWPPVSWSPDGNFAALVISSAEWQGDLLIFEINTGKYKVLSHDDLQSNQWNFPQMESLRTDEEGWASFVFDVLSCANNECTHPQVWRSVDASFKLSLLAESGLALPSLVIDRAGALFGRHAIIQDQKNSYNCLRSRDVGTFADCLRSVGEPESAIRAALAVSGEDWFQYVVDYSDLGSVDIAVLEWPAAGVGITSGFVLQGSDFVPADDHFSPKTIQDSASRAIAQRYPRADVMNASFFVGHRHLGGGRQRFIIAAPLTDGCRACDIVATAIGYVDYQNGQLVNEATVGWSAQRGEYPTSDAEVRRRLNTGDAREIQTQLNLRGYIAGPMDGIFGRASQAALSEFQRDHCLPETGRIDRATSEALVTADSFAPAPCIERLPVGVGRLPIAPGTFAFDNRQCTEGEAAWEELIAEYGEMSWTVGTYQIGENEIRFGASECRVLRSTLTGGTLSVSAQCLEEGMGPFFRQMIFENLGSNSFSIPRLSGEDLAFFRCSEPQAETPIVDLRPDDTGRLCCTNQVTGEVPLSLDGFIPQLP